MNSFMLIFYMSRVREPQPVFRLFLTLIRLRLTVFSPCLTSKDVHDCI